MRTWWPCDGKKMYLNPFGVPLFLLWNCYRAISPSLNQIFQNLWVRLLRAAEGIEEGVWAPVLPKDKYTEKISYLFSNGKYMPQLKQPVLHSFYAPEEWNWLILVTIHLRRHPSWFPVSSLFSPLGSTYEPWQTPFFMQSYLFFPLPACRTWILA